LADLLEDFANVGIIGRLDFDKPGLEARLGAIKVDALKEDSGIAMALRASAVLPRLASVLPPASVCWTHQNPHYRCAKVARSD
jgi:hypothetical protein